jgi:hypothetical protein
MAKFTATKGLNQLVAQMIVGDVDKIVDAVQTKAKKLAPPTKTWQTMMDDKVRPSHVSTQGQEVPDNLRFDLPSMPWDMTKRYSLPKIGARTYLLRPKDEDTYGSIANTINCRCRPVMDPLGIAKLVKKNETKAAGTKVKGLVFAEGALVQGAEYGDFYTGLPMAEGTYFMHLAAAEMKVKLGLL